MKGQLLSRMRHRESAREKSNVKLLVATCHLCSHSSGQSKSYGQACRQRVHPSLRKAQQRHRALVLGGGLLGRRC